MPDLELDAIDINILRQVQIDASLPVEEMAIQCGASVSTLRRRLRKLRRGDVIIGERYVLNPKFATAKLAVVINLYTVRFDSLTKKNVKRLIASSDNIRRGYIVNGAMQYVLMCSFRNIDEFLVFTEENFISNDEIEKFESYFVVDTVKDEPLTKF